MTEIKQICIKGSDPMPLKDETARNLIEKIREDLAESSKKLSVFAADGTKVAHINGWLDDNDKYGVQFVLENGEALSGFRFKFDDADATDFRLTTDGIFFRRGGRTVASMAEDKIVFGDSTLSKDKLRIGKDGESVIDVEKTHLSVGDFLLLKPDGESKFVTDSAFDFQLKKRKVLRLSEGSQISLTTDFDSYLHSVGKDYKIEIDKVKVLELQPGKSILRASPNTQIGAQEEQRRINAVAGDFRFVFKELDENGDYKADGTDKEVMLSSMLSQDVMALLAAPPQVVSRDKTLYISHPLENYPGAEFVLVRYARKNTKKLGPGAWGSAKKGWSVASGGRTGGGARCTLSSKTNVAKIYDYLESVGLVRGRRYGIVISIPNPAWERPSTDARNAVYKGIRESLWSRVQTISVMFDGSGSRNIGIV